MDSGLCYSQLAVGFLSVAVFLEHCLDYGGVVCWLERYDGVCPELQDACGDWCDADCVFVEDAFDLAGDDYGDVLDFCGLRQNCHLPV